MTSYTKMIDVTRQNGVTVSALPVPGGILFITDASTESGNGIAVAVSTTFVPMSYIEANQYLRDLAEEQGDGT